MFFNSYLIYELQHNASFLFFYTARKPIKVDFLVANFRNFPPKKANSGLKWSIKKPHRNRALKKLTKDLILKKKKKCLKAVVSLQFHFLRLTSGAIFVFQLWPVRRKQEVLISGKPDFRVKWSGNFKKIVFLIDIFIGFLQPLKFLNFSILFFLHFY